MFFFCELTTKIIVSVSLMDFDKQLMFKFIIEKNLQFIFNSTEHYLFQLIK